MGLPSTQKSKTETTIPNPSIMKRSISYLFLAAASLCGLASAQTTAYTTPVGYTSVTCLAASDTIVSLPLRKSVTAAGALASNPSGSVLTIASAAYTDNQFAATHYVKFSTGPAAGKWYTITSNTATTLTINLNGDTLNAVGTNELEVIKFWTLAELIDPATCTSDPTTTPNAVVASSSTLGTGRKTELLIPNLVATGVNIAPNVTYYVHAGIWKLSGPNTASNNVQLWPDTYFIIRNPAMAASTKYVCAGEVDTKAFAISLGTQTGIKQDNFQGMPRPVDVTLNQLGLGGTPAFMSSTSQLGTGQRDVLLLFDNTSAKKNKAPVYTYYFHAGIWKKTDTGATDKGNDVIPAGSGFIIRKYQSGTGATETWTNPAPY